MSPLGKVIDLFKLTKATPFLRRWKEELLLSFCKLF